MAGYLWALIEEHMDNQRYRPSERQVAAELGVSQAGILRWKSLGGLPSRDNLVAIARLVDRPYREVLDAALADIGYIDMPEESDPSGDTTATTAPPLTVGEWDAMYADLERQGVSPRMIRQQLPPRPTGGPGVGEVSDVTGGKTAGQGRGSRRTSRGA